MRKILFTLIIIHFSFSITGAQWIQVSNGMGNLSVKSLTFNANNLYGGTDGFGVYLTTNNGINWTQTSLNNQIVYSLTSNSNNIFAGTISGVYLSANNGSNWIQTSLSNYPIWSLASNANNIFAGGLNGVNISTNNGLTWTTTLQTRVYSLTVYGNTVFASSRGSKLSYGVERSLNNGLNWSNSFFYGDVHALAMNGNYVYAGMSAGPSYNGVYLSTNNGATWAQSSLNFGHIYSLAVSGNNVFAGTDQNGVYISTDNGITWMQRNEGLGNATVRALCISNNYIFAGTDGNSVYRRPLNELTGIAPFSIEIPKQFSLSQNYPNPFNPVTIIKFQIANSSKIKLKIYDVLGREVAVLVNEQLKQGIYSVKWNASNFASGIYYVSLTTEGFSETKKMVLIK